MSDEQSIFSIDKEEYEKWKREQSQAVKLVNPTLADVERTTILNCLETTGGNRTQAAKILDISIRCLRNKLNQYRKEGHEIPQKASGDRS